MPLDFPLSPTNGQEYGNWIYSTTKGAWQSKPLTQAKTAISATAPASPAVGDQWFNSNEGTLYIYYSDGNSSQWIESRSPITADGYKSPNYVINGAFDVWQRSVGPVSAGNGGYVAPDRWYIYNNAVQTTTVAKETTIVPQGHSASLKLTQTGTSTTPYLMQSIETANVVPLEGKTVTVSAYVYGTVATTFAVGLRADTGVDKTPATGYATTVAAYQNSSIPAGTWTRITATGVVPIGTKTLRVDVSAVSITLSQPVYFAGIQLEEGSSATTFRRNAPTIQGEVAACQRYYVYARADYTTLTIFSSTDSWLGSTNAFFPTEMRAAPTITTWDTGGNSGQAHRQFTGSSGGVNAAVSIQYATTKGFRIGSSVAGATDRAGMYYITWTASAEL